MHGAALLNVFALAVGLWLLTLALAFVLWSREAVYALFD